MNENEWNSAVNAYNSSMSALTQTIDNMNRIEGNERSAAEQRSWSERMMQQQNEWSLNMWNKTNEYNDPSAQLERLKRAGLNPLYFGLDGSSAQSFQSAQPLSYERANLPNQSNTFASPFQASAAAAELTSLQLDNDLKRKELGWYDKEHQQSFDFRNASIDEIRQAIDESKNRVANGEMDIKLKAKDVDKKTAEIATEVARCVGLGLDNQLKEQLNPLMVRAQELENQLAETRNQYEAERILAELAETRAHTAALYAQAALDGAKKEGVDLDNVVKRAESMFAKSNAQNRANLLKWTADEQRYQTAYWHQTWKGKVSVANYYAEHYEEAFRNSWSKSGLEYGFAEHLGEGLGSLAILGTMLAF